MVGTSADRRRQVYSAIDLIIVWGATFGLVCIAANFASREHSLSGQLLTFFFLSALLSVAIVATRFHGVLAIILITLLVSIDQVDQLKFTTTNTRLHPTDFFILMGFLKEMDPSIAIQYRLELRVVFWLVAIVSASLPLLWLLERYSIRRVRLWRLPSGTLFVSILAAAVFSGVLLNSQYIKALAQLYSAQLQWEGKGLRIASLALQTMQLNEMDREIKSLIAAADRDPVMPTPQIRSASCGVDGCPDIIFVHLESVFDPSLLAEYHGTAGYLDRMEALSEARSESGLLRVHTWGGASWLTEFALLCAADPQLFGEAGVLPHMTLSPYVRHCVPNHLQRLGYETHAIYTTFWTFVGVGAGFKRYGIDDFIDVKKVGAPIDWHLQRDKYFVDKARALLASPSDRPRFIFVSTVWNHGPHGHMPDREIFPSPFDLSRAKDPALHDYMNRLNDTFNEMLAFERDVFRSKRPVAILFYGDHHPAFEKNFAPEFPPDAYASTDRLTLYRFATNYGNEKPSIRRTFSIEELSARFLEFAGISLPSQMAIVEALRKQCGAPDEKCPQRFKNAIGAAVLHD
jgi:phosphoglycerol transferase MdoB-like AlkP superfamily enzyme